MGLGKIFKSKQFKDFQAVTLDTEKEPDYFDTGSYAINSILSGNVYRGFRSDSVSCVAGVSGSGKSYILGKCVKSAQDQGYETVIFDSERAVKKNYYENMNADVSKIYRVPVTTILDLRNKITQLVEEYYSDGEEHKLFIGIDSIGNLAGDKEFEDAMKDKDASDMGTSAKAASSLVRVVSSLASKYDFPVVMIAHVYSNPANMFSNEPIVAGGNKVVYIPHCTILMEPLVNKEEVVDEFGKKKKTSVGTKFKVKTLKNRDVPPNQITTTELRYDMGLDRYSGLLGLAIKAGIIENKTRGYYVKHLDKTVYEKDMNSEEIYTPEILEQINEYLATTGYSKASNVFDEAVEIFSSDVEDEDIE